MLMFQNGMNYSSLTILNKCPQAPIPNIGQINQPEALNLGQLSQPAATNIPAVGQSCSFIPNLEQPEASIPYLDQFEQFGVTISDLGQSTQLGSMVGEAYPASEIGFCNEGKHSFRSGIGSGEAYEPTLSPVIASHGVPSTSISIGIHPGLGHGPHGLGTRPFGLGHGQPGLSGVVPSPPDIVRCPPGVGPPSLHPADDDDFADFQSAPKLVSQTQR